MDLFGYLQIDRLQDVADKNGISIPRVRGYRLMSEEKAVTKEELQEDIVDSLALVYEKAIFHFKGNYSDEGVNKLKKKLFIRDYAPITLSNGMTVSVGRTVDLRWNLLHGKNKKIMKYMVKK